jgi:threonine synthase
MRATIRCADCSAEYDLDQPIARCRSCGGMLALRYDLAPGGWGERFAARRGRDHRVERSGVWRYRELVHPAAADRDVVSFPEGNTPLLDRRAVADWAGAPKLTLKHEGMNPTGSFKDRGMTVAVTQAKRVGARAVVCASTGNTSASMAAYAADAGLLGVVLVPAGKVAVGKLAQTVAYGARILAVRGDFDACLKLVDDASERLGLYLANSINPFRLEGQKTIALELLEQRGWRVPDWIALPGGNLGNTSALGKGLLEARALGLIDRLPRLAVIQAEGAAPFARGYREGFSERHRVRAETVATAIRIGDPASWNRAVEVVRATDGVVITVSDAEIMEAKAAIDGAGVGCEPASAASVAGVRALIKSGGMMAGADVVAILTGHVLKDPDAALEGRPRPTEIEPTLEALERAIRP